MTQITLIYCRCIRNLGIYVVTDINTLRAVEYQSIVSPFSDREAAFSSLVARCVEYVCDEGSKKFSTSPQHSIVCDRQVEKDGERIMRDT